MYNITKYLATAGSLVALMQASYAAAIVINNIDPGAGTYSNFTSVASDTNTFVLSRTFDFDGGGTDDTLSFTLTRTTYGPGTITGNDVAVGTVNAGGNTNNWYSSFADKESLKFEVSGIMFTSGEMDGTTVAFTGFTNVTRTNFTSGEGAGTATIDYLIHTGPVGSTTFTSANVPIDLTSAGASETLFITAGDGAGGIRIRDLDLAFETVPVPEPSSTALLGLGGLALILRRRK